MNALILCAGIGSRFAPISAKVAKPAIPFLNVPLLGYSLYYLEKLGLKNLVINTHHLPQVIEQTAARLTHEKKYSVRFSPEPKILGSGGGIKNAQDLILGSAAEKSTAKSSESFVVTNGDEFILFAHDKGFQPLLDFHRQEQALVTLLTTDHPEAGKSLGGVWADNHNQITCLGAKDKAPNAQHFTGVYAFSPEIFSLMPAKSDFHIFNDCLLPAIQRGKKVLAYHDPELLWLDTSSERDYIHSTRQALEELAKTSARAANLKNILQRFQQKIEQTGERQWQCPKSKFLGKLDPAAFLFMGPDSEIGAGVEISGFAVLGANARFEQGFIESSVIAPQLHVNELVALRKQLVI